MYLTGAGALLASTGAFAQETKSMNAVSNRAHILIHPSLKDRSIWCFSSILGCGAPISLSAPGKPEPILAFRFPGGGSVSIEFTEQALDEAEARRGAWLELKSENPAELKKKVIEAGLPQVQYWATKVFYFVVPGGQVFGIFQPEEMR
jgi:hypothetical protein